MNSEHIFGISMQPSNTCPYIDKYINSISEIGEYEIIEDDEGNEFEELIEVNPDFGSLKAALDNADDIKEWSLEWIQLYEDILLIHFNNIIDDYSIIENPNDEQINNYDNAIDALDQLSTLNSCSKTINDIYYNIEKSYSHILFQTDKNSPNAVSECESFRDTIVELRETGNLFKTTIKEVALNFIDEIPELYDSDKRYKQFKEEERKRIANTLNSLNTKPKTLNIGITNNR